MTKCEDCETSWSYGVAPKRCHIDKNGEHCYAVECDGNEHE